MRVGQGAMGFGERCKVLRREVDSTEGRSSGRDGQINGRGVNYH